MNLHLFQQLGEAAARQAGGRGDRYLNHLQGLIASAGDPAITPAQLLGLQMAGLVVLPAAAFFIFLHIPFMNFVFGGPHTAVLVVALMGLGFLFPKINLGERVQARQEEIVRQIPDMMDLLAVCVEAGMDFLSALRVVVQNQPTGPLREEFERFLKQLELGVPRVDALHEMSRRVDVPDMSSICAVLVQATKLGSPLGPILKTQAEMLRTRRGLRAEKAAAGAAVKVLGPLGLCIFPAVFIAILGPVVLKIREAFGQ